MVAPGPIGVLLCRQTPERAIVVGFEDLPSGVQGAVQQDGRVEPGFSLSRIGAVDTSRLSLAQVKAELARADDASAQPGASNRVLGFSRTHVDATVRAAIEDVRAQQQFNIYARISARTQFFRTWKRAFFIFEVPTALSVYRDRREWQQRVSRGLELDTSTIKLVLALGDAEVPVRVGALGLRTYRVAEKQLQLFKFKVEVGSRHGIFGGRPRAAVTWATVAKFSHPSESVVRALRSRMIDGGGLDAAAAVVEKRRRDSGRGAAAGGGSAGDSGSGARNVGTGFANSFGTYGEDDFGADVARPTSHSEDSASGTSKYDQWGTIGESTFD